MTKPKKLDEIDGIDPNYNAVYEGLLEIANAIRDLTDYLREAPRDTTCDCDHSGDDLTTH